MSISASQVKELREKTGAGMMDCKTALTENGGDMEAAVDWLRAKGIAKADKKSGRTAAEGLVGVLSDSAKAVLVEINSETDFVARNEAFQDLVRGVAKTALGTDGTIDAVAQASYAGSGKTVSETITDAIATIGENMNLRRTAMLSVETGVVASYMHNSVADGLGKLGVIVALKSSGDRAKLAELGRQIAMHVAASSPLAVNADDVDKDVAQRERAIFVEQAKESGKPDNIVEKMVDGRMRKFFEEVALVSQAFVMNTDLTVGEAVKAAEEDVGGPVEITGFERFRLGEGVDKEENDFASEVAAAVQG